MSEVTHARATRVLDEAMRLMSEKNASYNDAWREQGWRGCLARIMSKTTRLRNMLWRSHTSLLNGDKEHPRETALDMINHLVFFILNLDDDREWGTEETPTPSSEYATPGANGWQQSDEALHPTYLPPHPEQPPAMGQHTMVNSAQGAIIEEPPANPFPKVEEQPSTPSPRPRGGKRQVRDAPQA